MPVGNTMVLDHAGTHIRHALRSATAVAQPFPYWLLHEALPPSLARAVIALPFMPPCIADTLGRRETNNSTRIFVSPENRHRFAACESLAEAFQDDATCGLLEDVCGIGLAGSFLRIECCLDTNGFWLEPHTDVGAKLLTMLVYLSDHPDAAEWGTDIMDADGHVLARAPGTFNSGLIFIPGSDTWHGFTPRPLRGVRRSLIVNYVRPEWRSRHELAFPETPVLSGD